MSRGRRPGGLRDLPLEHRRAGTENIGTSTRLAAWDAAVYVAQIDDDRINRAMSDGAYLDATAEVVARHGGLWFVDESFVVVRRE